MKDRKKKKKTNPENETKDLNPQPTKNPTPSIKSFPRAVVPTAAGRAGGTALAGGASPAGGAQRDAEQRARGGWAGRPGARCPWGGRQPPLPAVVIFILIGDHALSRPFSAVVGARLGSPAGIGRLVRQQPEPLPAPCAGPRVGRAPGACGGLSGSGDRKAPRLLGETVGLQNPCRGCLLPPPPGLASASGPRALPRGSGRRQRTGGVWGLSFPELLFLSVLEETLTITDH